MKRPLLLTLCLMSSSIAASAQETKPAAPAVMPAAAPAARTYTDQELMTEFGWFIGKRVGITELDLSKAEVEGLIKGMQTAAEGKESPFTLEEIGPKMDEFMQKKQAAFQQKAKAKASAANTAFLAKLKENKAVVVLPSGLAYEIIKPGEGPFPTAQDTVKVHYTGSLVDGSVFDTSLKPRQPGMPVEPAEFPLGQVIPGWTEGLQKINKGGKLKLYVPPQLGYGDQSQEGIPAGSLLIFDVELLDVKPAPAAAPAPVVAPAAPAPVK